MVSEKKLMAEIRAILELAGEGNIRIARDGIQWLLETETYSWQDSLWGIKQFALRCLQKHRPELVRPHPWGQQKPFYENKLALRRGKNARTNRDK